MSSLLTIIARAMSWANAPCRPAFDVKACTSATATIREHRDRVTTKPLRITRPIDPFVVLAAMSLPICRTHAGELPQRCIQGLSAQGAVRLHDLNSRRSAFPFEQNAVGDSNLTDVVQGAGEIK